MRDAIEMTLTGDMEGFLDKISEAAGEKTLRATGFAGAFIIRNEAERLAPKDTGNLARNVIIKRLEEKSDSNKIQTFLVTVRSGKTRDDGAFYWRWVEDGHKFVGRNKKSGKGANWKRHRKLMEAEYGSSKKGARPFLRPAYTNMRTRILKVMAEKMAEKFAEYMGTK